MGHLHGDGWEQEPAPEERPAAARQQDAHTHSLHSARSGCVLLCCTEAVCVCACVCLCLCLHTQKREAEQQAHDALVAQNQGLEREYQRFEKKQKLMKSIQVCWQAMWQPEDLV